MWYLYFLMSSARELYPITHISLEFSLPGDEVGYIYSGNGFFSHCFDLWIVLLQQDTLFWAVRLFGEFYKQYGEVTASKHGSLTFPAAHTWI